MDDTFEVPDGHQLLVVSASLVPNVRRTPGGTIIANLGVAGDDVERELASVLAAVDAELARPITARLLDAGTTKLSSLVEPSEPPTRALVSPLSWVLHRGALATLRVRGGYYDRWLGVLRQLADRGTSQVVFVVEPPSPGHAALARQLAELAIPLRAPDDRGQGPIVHIEVTRPGGVIGAIAGTTYDLTAVAPSDAAPIAFRSPRTRELVLAMQDGGGDAAMTALVHDVLAREIPLLFMTNSGSVNLRMFGIHKAWPIYADVTSLGWAAADLQLPNDAYDLGAITGRQLFVNAANAKLALAFCAYRDREHPVHAVVSADAVAELAQLAR